MAYRTRGKTRRPASRRGIGRRTSSRRTTGPKRRRVSRSRSSVKTVKLVIEAPQQPTGRLPLTADQLAVALKGNGRVKKKITF